MSSVAARGIVRDAGSPGRVDGCDVCAGCLRTRKQHTPLTPAPFAAAGVRGGCAGGVRGRGVSTAQALGQGRCRERAQRSPHHRRLQSAGAWSLGSAARVLAPCTVATAACRAARCTNEHAGGLDNIYIYGAVMGAWLCAHTTGDGALGRLDVRRASSLGWSCWGARSPAAGVLPSTKTG